MAEDSNDYLLVEASDWVALARDWAKNPGKLRKPARDGLIEFLAWFAAEGIYAQAYKDPRGRYGYWTNYTYRGLFGMDAAQMKEVWENPVHGSSRIARNYIPESVGLEAVAYCERMVAQLDLDDIQQAHDLAIQATRLKFARYFPVT